MTSSVLNEFYFYRGYVHIHDFGEEYSDCSVVISAEWFPADTIEAKPKIWVIDHFIFIYSGLYDHTGYVENSGPGVLQLMINNYCPCGAIESVYENITINPVVVEDIDRSFPRDGGLIQFARIETCDPDCVTWVVSFTETITPEMIPINNHLVITAGVDLVRNGSSSFIDYVPSNEMVISPIQSSPCAEVVFA